MRFGCKENPKLTDPTKWHLYYIWKPVKALSGNGEECRVMFELVWRRRTDNSSWDYRTVEYLPND